MMSTLLQKRVRFKNLFFCFVYPLPFQLTIYHQKITLRQNDLPLNQISELNNASTDTGKEFNIDVEINDGEPLPGSTMKLCPLIPPGNELVHNMCKFFFLLNGYLKYS